MQKVESHQPTPSEMETIMGEIENIDVQCQTRKIEGSNDKETGYTFKRSKNKCESSCIDALENASSAVATPINENQQQENAKNTYHSVGRFVMQHYQSQSMSIKDALTEADSKWSKK